MQRRLPLTNDSSRAAWLRQVQSMADLPGADGTPLLPANLLNQVSQLEAPFLEAVRENQTLLAERTRRVEQCDAHLAQLANLVRGYWATLKVRQKVLKQSAGILKLHGSRQQIKSRRVLGQRPFQEREVESRNVLGNVDQRVIGNRVEQNICVAERKIQVDQHNLIAGG